MASRRIGRWLLPEIEAARVYEEARKEFEGLGEPWAGYRVDVTLLAAFRFDLGVEIADLNVNNRRYGAFLHADAGLITVSEVDNEHRRRFSVAHEIGHYVLHYLSAKEAVRIFGCQASDFDTGRRAVMEESLSLHARREWEANLFAAELLMPETPFLVMYRAVKGQVRRLAFHFQVSPQAAEIRLRRFGLHG